MLQVCPVLCCTYTQVPTVHTTQANEPRHKVRAVTHLHTAFRRVPAIPLRCAALRCSALPPPHSPPTVVCHRQTHTDTDEPRGLALAAAPLQVAPQRPTRRRRRSSACIPTQLNYPSSPSIHPLLSSACGQFWALLCRTGKGLEWKGSRTCLALLCCAVQPVLCAAANETLPPGLQASIQASPHKLQALLLHQQQAATACLSGYTRALDLALDPASFSSPAKYLAHLTVISPAACMKASLTLSLSATQLLNQH